MLAIKLRCRHCSFEGIFWKAWLLIALVAFSFTVGRSIMTHRATNLGQVPLKPCKACIGCACPKVLGGPRCACPE